jgi:hypothetical protein
VDYEAFDMTITIPARSEGGREVCCDITILNDEGFERNEFFRLNVESEGNVVIHEEYIKVHIQDDDSE